MLVQDSEKLCRFHNQGYCKFEEKGNFKHVQIICQDGQHCCKKQCQNRHTKPCRFHFLKQKCKFKDKCLFSHTGMKEEEQLKQIKEEIDAIKKKNTELDNDIEALRQKNKDLEDENSKMKDENKNLKKSVDNKEMKMLKSHQMHKEAVKKLSEVKEVNTMLIEDIRILNDRLDDDIDFSFIYEAFQCESCEYRSNYQRGLNVNIGKKA